MMIRNLFLMFVAALVAGCAAPRGPEAPRSPQITQAAFTCGGDEAMTTFDAHGMVLTMKGASYNLEQVIAASGAKYETLEGATPHVTFWNKGQEATITIDGVFVPTCTQVVKP